MRIFTSPTAIQLKRRYFSGTTKLTWNANDVGGVTDMGTINKTPLLGGKTISFVVDSGVGVIIIAAKWLKK